MIPQERTDQDIDALLMEIGRGLQPPGAFELPPTRLRAAGHLWFSNNIAEIKTALCPRLKTSL